MAAIKLKKCLLVIYVWISLCVVVWTIPSLVPGVGTYTSEYPAGIISGLWHGLIAPASLICGYLDTNIRIYENVNVGWLYDLGYLISFAFIHLLLKIKGRLDD